MKILVVYDSVSPMKLTMKVAEAIVDALKAEEIEVDSFSVENVNRETVKSYDCLLVGGPKMYFKAAKGIMKFLDSFQDKEFSGKFAAEFDTEVKSGVGGIGNATKAMENKLRKLGFEIVSPPLIAYVEGKINQMQLKDGELEKTKNWAKEVAKALLK
jgi:flavodoxin